MEGQLPPTNSVFTALHVLHLPEGKYGHVCPLGSGTIANLFGLSARPNPKGNEKCSLLSLVLCTYVVHYFLSFFSSLLEGKKNPYNTLFLLLN